MLKKLSHVNKAVSSSLLASILILVMFVVQPVSLEAETGLILSPAITTLNLRIGDVESREIRLTNNSGVDHSFKLTVAEYFLQEEGVKSIVTEGIAAKYDWVNIPSSIITIKQGETKTIAIKLAPKSIPAKTYFPIIIFQPQTNNAANVAINQQIAAVFRINITKDSSIPLPLFSINELKGTFLSLGQPINVDYGINNLSDFVVRPNIYLQFIDTSQQILHREIITEADLDLLPNEKFDGQAQLGLDKLNSYLLPEKIQFELLAIDQQFGINETAKYTVWYISPYFIIISLITLTLVAIVIGNLVYRRKANILKTA